MQIHLRAIRCGCRLLLVLAVLASASVNGLPSTLRPEEADVKMVALETHSLETVRAVYLAGGDTFYNFTASVQTALPAAWRADAEESASYVVSTVSVTGLGERGPFARTVSQLVLPGAFLLDRVIPDMETRVIYAAKEMLETLKSLGGMELDDIVYVYDTIVQDLVQQLDLPGKFSQSRVSANYHKYIARAARRMARGIDPDRACPAHPAYEHQGLFACEQEYDEHLETALAHSALARACGGPGQCVDSLRAKLLGDDAAKVVEGAAAAAVKGAITRHKSNSSWALLPNYLPTTPEGLSRFLACGATDCKQRGCGSRFLFAEGWFIYGTDTGCCGTYPGCCLLASGACLGYDLVCSCCTFPVFCVEPLCQPADWCP